MLCDVPRTSGCAVGLPCGILASVKHNSIGSQWLYCGQSTAETPLVSGRDGGSSLLVSSNVGRLATAISCGTRAGWDNWIGTDSVNGIAAVLSSVPCGMLLTNYNALGF